MSDRKYTPELDAGDPRPFRFLPKLSAAEYKCTNEAQRVPVATVRLLDPTLERNRLKERVAELIPHSDLFDPEIKSLPFVYRDLRDLLQQHGFSFPQHSSRYVVSTLTSKLYEEATEREIAMEYARSIITNRKKGPPTQELFTKTPPRPPSEQHGGGAQYGYKMQGVSKERIAYNVTFTFKDLQSIFTGALGECCAEYLDSYKNMSWDYSLNDEENRQ